MCVLALAWRMDPRWLLLAAGNRDELHARPALPLAQWDDAPQVIAGRDVAGGGTWLGVSTDGRFAVVTNVRSAAGRDPAKASRGGLVAEMLSGGEIGMEALDEFNPFNLIVVDGASATFLSNRPAPVRRALTLGMHGLSNGLGDTPWPKTVKLQAAVRRCVGSGDDPAGALFEVLRDETPPGAAVSADGNATEPVDSPIFIRDARYGTRCSTVVTVDGAGRGMIAERRFDSDGSMTGETRLAFVWPD